MKFLKSKFFIITLIVALSVALVTGILAMVGLSGPIKLALGTAAKPFSYVGSYAANAVNGFVQVFTDYDDLKAENEVLKQELDALKDEKYNAEVIQKENLWLREYINFANGHQDFALTDARIIGRSADNYSTVITLDKGGVHGIKNGMAVITSEGVLGRVIEVGLDYCRVERIVEAQSSVGVRIQRSEAEGILQGDAGLEGVCKMTFINGDADIKIGDKVYTSGGSGSYYPSGLYVGEVSAIDADESTRQLIATVTPAASLEDAAEQGRVMIITGYVSK